jgi:hypothetical protein
MVWGKVILWWQNISKYPSPPLLTWELCTGVAKWGQPRCTIPKIKADILDVVNETPGIRTRKISLQVVVAHSTARRMLRE